VSDLAEFDAAMEATFDPQASAEEEDSDGARVISLTSKWFSGWCGKCGHTFRRGDRVREDPDSGEMRHLEPGLGCDGGPEPGGQAKLRELTEFLAGLEETWPVAGDLPVVLSDMEPRLLTPSVGGLRRMICLYCGDTIRPHELVIVCPCSPRERRCWYPVHRDPGLGLVCWENWRPSGRLDHCTRRGGG
jgi:hypothetical protein